MPSAPPSADAASAPVQPQLAAGPAAAPPRRLPSEPSSVLPVTAENLGEAFKKFGSDSARLAALEAGLKYNLVVVPEGGKAVAASYSTIADLVAAIQAYGERKVQVFVFYGERWNVTSGPFPFLVAPNDRVPKIPLLSDPGTPEVDEEGWFGRVDREDTLPNTDR